MTGTVRFCDWNRPLSAEAQEISANGIFLRSETNVLPNGAVVTMQVALPGLQKAFTVMGKVVRTVRGSLLKPPGLGIQFVDIAAADRRMVLEYVARRTLRTA